MRFLFPANSNVIQSTEEAKAEREIIDEFWNYLLYGPNWREEFDKIRNNLKTNNIMEKLQGYSMKAKEKREFISPVIKRTAKGGYMIHGVDKEGNKMVAIIGKDNAETAVAEGLAKKEGW